MSKAFYNEIDPKAAAWLRELIKQGLIAPGDVDERSIVDIRPSDLRDYTQCHFFAGIGVWSYALRRAGWGDDRPVWTGSCPCQPFSAAGKRGGVKDERHLWPEFFRLINECRPVTIFGEQVASKDGLAWLDALHLDLEGAGYSIGATDTCAAGFGAPHIRQRLHFVAQSLGLGRGGRSNGDPTGACREVQIEGRSAVGGVADSSETRRDRPCTDLSGCKNRNTSSGAVVGGCDGSCIVADADDPRPQGRRCGVLSECTGERAAGQNGGPCNGFWSNAEWIWCRDEKYRAVEPGTFPLAHGSPARVGRLRGYGNCIVAPQAQAFIKAYMEVCG